MFGESLRRVQDHSFLASRVNQNINYIFGTLMSRAIDRYINESILRRSGGVREFWGGLKILLGHFYELLIICLES